MTVKPIRALFFCLPILVASALLVGCGNSSCNSKYANCPAFGSNSGSGSGTGTGTGGGTGGGSGSGGGGAASGPFTVGGTVVGLTGTGLVIQDNGSDTLNISQNGPFTFAVPVASGSNYAVI